MSVRIGYSVRAQVTKAFALIAEGWNELVQDGFSPDLVGVCPVLPDDEVIYAYSTDGDPVGVLVYRAIPDQEALEVVLGYVEPSSRQQHVFTEMFMALQARAKQAQIGVIRVQVHPANKEAVAVLATLNGKTVNRLFEHAVV